VMTIGYWLNLILSFGLIFITNLIQFRLLNQLKPTKDPVKIPFKQLIRDIPQDLRSLLTAEIILRWGDWFVRDFAVLYVVGVLLRTKAEAGLLLAVTSLTALITYIPMGKIVDSAKVQSRLSELLLPSLPCFLLILCCYHAIFPDLAYRL